MLMSFRTFLLLTINITLLLRSKKIKIFSGDILHANIRSMKKNFENFRDLCYALEFRFSIIQFYKKSADQDSFGQKYSLSVEKLYRHTISLNKEWLKRRTTLSLFMNLNIVTTFATFCALKIMTFNLQKKIKKCNSELTNNQVET